MNQPPCGLGKRSTGAGRYRSDFQIRYPGVRGTEGAGGEDAVCYYCCEVRRLFACWEEGSDLFNCAEAVLGE